MVCYAINEIFGPALIKFPSTIEEIKSVTQKFELKFDIPQVIGCVDRTHIPIVQPPENLHNYFSYRMKFSLKCQAICDENDYFTDVELRWPGSVHDACLCVCVFPSTGKASPD